MNDIEKAIEDLRGLSECSSISSTIFKEQHGKNFNLAISALEKQLPKEPIEKQFNLKGDLIGLCPVCKVMWCIKYKEYCANCGQKISWSEAQE